MIHTPTVKQAAALALIEDNPLRVEATSRLRDDLLHVHGILERGLLNNGWVSQVSLGEHTRVAYGSPVTVELFVWKLTMWGADALRDATLAGKLG